jgi:hypothetical protein
MLYVPHIRDYKPFYIQTGTASSAVDIKTAYKVIIKTHDYPSYRKPKEPYKNDWKDENGDDEYTAQMYYQAFTFKAECVMFASGQTARADLTAGVREFMDALSGEFKTYDEWTGFGFQKVRLSEFRMPSEGDFDEMDGYARIIFSVEFKVNDPITKMKLQNGSIVTA